MTTNSLMKLYDERRYGGSSERLLQTDHDITKPMLDALTWIAVSASIPVRIWWYHNRVGTKTVDLRPDKVKSPVILSMVASSNPVHLTTFHMWATNSDPKMATVLDDYKIARIATQHDVIYNDLQVRWPQINIHTPRRPDGGIDYHPKPYGLNCDSVWSYSNHCASRQAAERLISFLEGSRWER